MATFVTSPPSASVRIGREGVNTALQLGSAPAARARVSSFCRNTCTRLATDTAVALVVQGKVLDAEIDGVPPNLLPVPRRERAHFQNIFAAGQAMVLDCP